MVRRPFIIAFRRQTPYPTKACDHAVRRVARRPGWVAPVLHASGEIDFAQHVMTGALPTAVDLAPSGRVAELFALRERVHFRGGRHLRAQVTPKFFVDL